MRRKSAKEIKNELAKLLRVPENISRQKKRILTKIKLTPKEKKDIIFAQLMFYWMDQRKMMMMKFFFYFLSILQITTGHWTSSGEVFKQNALSNYSH